MRIVDIIFALICGRVAGFLAADLLNEWGIILPVYEMLIIWVALPFIALFCLWVAYHIGRKFLFVFQGAKHILVGAFATIVDLRLFELLAWIFALILPVSVIIAKGLSFIVATAIKFWGNKYWVFGKHDEAQIDTKKEVVQFFFITLVGLILDIAGFYYFTNILGPQFGFSAVIWVKLSVVFAAILAAVWNFIGYKFFVFKK